MSERDRIFGNATPQPQTTKEQSSWEIPHEVIPLPSGGLVYSGKLQDCKEIMIKAMTSREEDILTSPALMKKGIVINELLKSCIVDKQIDVDNMIIGDRNAIMIAIRITGYGAEYTAGVGCNQCGHKFSNSFDLSELVIKNLEVEPIEKNKNEFEFELPRSKKRVTFKLLTGLDEADINVATERAKKQGAIVENSVTFFLSKSIVSIDGKTDRSIISSLVQSMPAADGHALRKYIQKITPGIDMSVSYTCPSCDHSNEGVSLPLGAEFFWPSK